MTAETYDAPVRRRSHGPSPEFVGAAIAAVIVTIAVFDAFVGGTPPASPDPGGVGASPTSTSTAGPTVAPILDATVADLLTVTNQQLIRAAESLTAEIEREPFRTADVSTAIREVNAVARLGSDAVPSLDPTTAEGRALQAGLGEAYAAVRDVATRTLRASVSNAAAYRTGATDLVVTIAVIPDLQATLVALRSAPPPTPRPSASAAPTAVPSDPPASPVAPSPSTPPSPSPAPSDLPSQVVDGGFETGVGAPWELVTMGSAAATIASDPQDPASGRRAARIDITMPSGAYSGIALRQGGMSLQAGARYSLRLMVRAAGPRDIRIRLGSSSGDTYLTRSASVGTTWSLVSFTFTAPVSDGDAILAIEVGRDGATVWLDDVEFGEPLAPTA